MRLENAHFVGPVGVYSVSCNVFIPTFRKNVLSRSSWWRNLIQIENIPEGAIFGIKKAVGLPRLQYLKHVARITAAESYAYSLHGAASFLRS